METYESLLRAYFEKKFREMHETDKADWLRSCARMAAQMTLRGGDEAVWAARISLGQCEMAED